MDNDNITFESKQIYKGRNVSIDLLKIIIMLMVVILHALSYGMKKSEISPYSVIWIINVILPQFCIVAVNCFVLISGFFLSRRKNLKITMLSLKNDYVRILPLWMQVFSYSVGVYLIIVFCPIGQTVRKLG